MKVEFDSPEKALAVAQEALWLAYQNSHAAGLGWLHERGGEPREAVIEAGTREQYSDGRRVVSGDYIAGRMMKLHLTVVGNAVEAPDYEPRSDYQSWCRKYPTYKSLLDAAKDKCVWI